MTDQWLSIVDYARATGISDMTIRRRIRTGRIKAELRDGKYFIPVDVDYTGEIRHEKNQNQNNNVQAVKSHPGPERTLPVVRRGNESNHSSSYNVTPNRLGAPNHFNAPMRHYNNVPESMARPLVEAGLASVEARSLIEFCDRALEQARVTVQSTEAKYSARIDSMNAHLQNKDQEIKALNQQIEDLQLLVQILERKKVG